MTFWIASLVFLLQPGRVEYHAPLIPILQIVNQSVEFRDSRSDDLREVLHLHYSARSCQFDCVGLEESSVRRLVEYPRVGADENAPAPFFQVFRNYSVSNIHFESEDLQYCGCDSNVCKSNSCDSGCGPDGLYPCLCSTPEEEPGEVGCQAKRVRYDLSVLLPPSVAQRIQEEAGLPSIAEVYALVESSVRESFDSINDQISVPRERTAHVPCKVALNLELLRTDAEEPAIGDKAGGNRCSLNRPGPLNCPVEMVLSPGGRLPEYSSIEGLFFSMGQTAAIYFGVTGNLLDRSRLGTDPIGCPERAQLEEGFDCSTCDDITDPRPACGFIGFSGVSDPRIGRMLVRWQAPPSTWMHELGHLKGLGHYGDLDRVEGGENVYRLEGCEGDCPAFVTPDSISESRLMAKYAVDDRDYYDVSCRDCQYLRSNTVKKSADGTVLPNSRLGPARVVIESAECEEEPEMPEMPEVPLKETGEECSRDGECQSTCCGSESSDNEGKCLASNENNADGR